MWQDEFGAKANVRGEHMRIDGVEARVSGVAPAWLEGLYRDRAVDLWMPLREKKLHGADRRSRDFWVLARLRRNISTNQAQSALQPRREASSETIVHPYTGMTPEMAQGISRIGTLLGIAAGIVFLIGCANVASFLLGRAFARSRETSLRVALGASRGQLAQELLWDSIVISFAGGACGMLLAGWTARIIPALLFDQDAERLVFAPGPLSIVAASAACIGITIVCGLVPVLAARNDRPEAVLRRESAGSSKMIRRLRMGLVVAQMASCCILVISTAFLLNGFRATLRTSASHRLGDPILATMQALPETGIRYFEQVQQAAQSTVGLSEMAWAAQLPGSQPVWRAFRIDAQNLPQREVSMDIAWFTAGSLKLFVLPLSAGRMFGFGDQRCRVAIVDKAAAAELFDSNTVGRIVQDPTGLPVEVIGVVEEKARNNAMESRPTIYYNHADQTTQAPERIALARFRAPVPSELVTAQLDTNVVSPNYFEAMGLTLITGQEFTSRPTARECRVGVVNQEASDLYFNGKPVGAAVIDDRGIRTAIVGAVRSKPLGALQRHAEPAIYLPMSQDCRPRMTLIAGARKVNGPMLADLRRRIESVQGGGRAPIVITTLATHLSRTALAPLRIAIVIMSTSSVIAIMLGILGLLGALSDSARQRRRELAIRVALGAQRRRIIYQVVKEGGRLACAGILVGMLGSLALARLLSRITTDSSSPALWVWLAPPVVLAVTVLIASVLPARNALMANPLTIMRDDG
jgi:ABC-type antimicrobial peptide transport system permease subunit